MRDSADQILRDRVVDLTRESSSRSWTHWPVLIQAAAFNLYDSLLPLACTSCY
jgi:hypothetical protein